MYYDSMNDFSQDNDTEAPFGEPEDGLHANNLSHPRYDGDLDDQEIYDEGMAGAAGVNDFSNRRFD